MDIKLKVFLGLLTLFIFIGLLLGLLTENCCAELQHEDISILGNPTYKLTNKVIKNNQVLGRTYLVNVTLYNAGNLRSKELTVNLTDEEGYSLSDYTYLDPGETKIISFYWSTMLNRDQQISINFFPSNLVS